MRRLVLGLVVLLGLLAVGSLMIEEPLRRTLERRVNASLSGYTATIGRVDLRFTGFGIVLRDVTVVQNAMPNPPLAYLPEWTTSVQWRALLSGALVADTTFTRPELFLTFQQARAEAADSTPASEHGWQDAVTSIYPLEINHLRVVDAKLSYFDTGELPPIHITRLNVRAEDIRNVKSHPGRYPSPLDVRATLADGTNFEFRGRADFLAEPQATLKGRFDMEELALPPLAPALRHAAMSIKSGRVAAHGRVEQSRDQLRLAVDSVSLDDAHIEYLLEKPADRQALEDASKLATTPEAKPAMRLDVREAVIRNGLFAIQDRQSDPPYRVFLDRTAARVRDFSNQRDARRGSAVVDGRFQGAGPLHLDASFSPTAKKPDFALKLRVEDVDLTAMNDVLRAQAGIDVVKGRLSVYTEFTVRDGWMEGYVKPLFREMDVYDSQQDRDKNPLRKAYEAIVGGASSLLENRPREEVATVTNVSGPVENPRSSTLQVLLNLLRNAFIQAILPGLEPARRGSE